MNDTSITNAVVTKNLSRRFRHTDALRDVSLTIPVGSVFGLIGLNGAGKTTLIRHLIGMLKPQTGLVKVLGADPTIAPERTNKRIGYMTEEDSLPKWMRVGELMDFNRAIYPTWDDAYAAKLLASFGLSRGNKLTDLSKGVRARAGLLAAIAHRPELLILDEPSSGLDPLARNDILEAIIRSVASDGNTVLFSSHLLDEVERVCDTFGVMCDGELVETTTAEVMEAEYEEFVVRRASCDDDEQKQEVPPDIAGVTDWRRLGDEWSGIVASSAEIGLPGDGGMSLVARRPASLERWFAAKASSESAATSPAEIGEVVR